MNFSCPEVLVCAGCPWGLIEKSIQNSWKENSLLSSLKNLFNSTEFEFGSYTNTDGYHRHRADFISFDNELGLYSKEKSLVPISQCSQLSPELHQLYKFARSIPFDVKKGSLRLRVSPDGDQGLWLDFSNNDIKRLFEDEGVFKMLSENNIHCEIGQKGKKLTAIKNSDAKSPHKESLQRGFSLKEPEPLAWFQFLMGERVLPLYSLISSFTQPSYLLNIEIQKIIQGWIKNLKLETILEFGAGVGNFTLSLTSLCDHIFTLENDPRNLVALIKNIKQYGLENKISVSKVWPFKNINSKNEKNQRNEAVNYFPLSLQNPNLFFVNPPRSGVGRLFDQEISSEWVLYISCYLDSLLIDLEKLKKYGYRLEKAYLFDQFPQTSHFEILMLLKK